MSDAEYIYQVILSIELIWFILFFLILMHEYGHAIAAKFLGMEVEKLSVGWPIFYRIKVRGLHYEFGAIPVFGFVMVPLLPNSSLKDRAVFAAAGPVASALLGFFLLAFSSGSSGDLFGIAGHASLTLAAVSLIPLPPMDGWPIAQYIAYRLGYNVPNSSAKLTSLGILSIAISVLVVLEFGGL